MAPQMTFGTLDIAYDDRVLRPRTWTTTQSRWAAELLAEVPAGPVLELCSGAGQIGLLAVAASDRRLLCVDASEAACEFALANARSAGMADRVEVRLGPLDEALAPDERFPLVIADPPWVPGAETGRFPEDPLSAIDGGPDGLDVARACLRVVAAHLGPDGAAVLQLGTREQAERLGQEARELGHLVLSELRHHERGVLVRVDRSPGS